MAKFKFKLQKLLELREREENNKKNLLAKVQSRINIENAVIVEMAVRRKDILTSSSVKGRSYNSNELSLHRMMVLGTENRVSCANSKLQDMQPELDAARQEFMEARKNRLAIEKLRDKRKKEYDLETRRREAVELSEIGEQMYNRRR